MVNMKAYATIRNLSKISELVELGKANPTLCHLGKKLNGADATTAYHIIRNLNDHEMRIIAAMIGEINTKFK